MKTTLLCSILFTIIIIPGYSQDSDEIQRLSDMRLSYGASFIAGEAILLNSGSLVPYGIGLNLTLNLSKRINSDFGIAIMTTDKSIYDTRGIIVYDSHFSPQIYYEWRDIYINIPVHINYKLLDYEPFKFLISAGPELIIRNHRCYQNPG
ncbi:unnamed protein product, partial [marine sediment metagenome]